MTMPTARKKTMSSIAAFCRFEKKGGLVYPEFIAGRVVWEWEKPPRELSKLAGLSGSAGRGVSDGPDDRLALCDDWLDKRPRPYFPCSGAEETERVRDEVPLGVVFLSTIELPFNNPCDAAARHG
jgi:hypothetical protein